MVPFKPYFTGVTPPPHPRAVSLQKCVRTTDIDSVGVTARYNTFFQMAGNFSFGDYDKPEAITYAWDLLMRSERDGGLGVDPDRVWVTVYEKDDESLALWRRIAGLPVERIQRLGREDNLWDMGVPGPCGPSSEIFVDRGPAYGPDGGPAVDTDRFMEIWNLVFMRDVRGPGEGKDYPILGPLPQHNVDTGLGLERTAVVLQGVGSVYETDLLRPLLDRASELSGRRYGTDRSDDVGLRIVADHIRTSLMLVADGIRPARDGRGYVLRRLLRRTVRSMQRLGADEPVLGELTSVAHGLMLPIYPELDGELDRISTVISGEEDGFRRTLRSGRKIFDLASTTGRITGEQAFALHDTHGFPFDLTLDVAGERGLSVDEDGFRRLMEQQRQRSRSGRFSPSPAVE
jgi:alanyl-tRNA synthetase